MTKEQDDLEAQEFLNSLELPPEKKSTENSLPISGFSDKEMLKDNEEIIKKSNALLLDKLDEGEDLAIKDIISMKSEAFKNNRSILGEDEDTVDVKKLIPTNINIQIINN
jgi:hypothetical protein